METFPKNYWFGNKRAAISLTYDDGYVSNLDVAIPQLEAAGLRGTFYLITNLPDVQNNILRWEAAFKNRHEIGNHTANHPCGYALLALTRDQLIKRETGIAEDWLIDKIGYDKNRSFAFPCTFIRTGDVFEGATMTEEFRQMYLDVIRRTYRISRTGFGEINNDYAKLSIDQHEIDGNAILFDQPSVLQPFVDYCKKALNSGGWAVIIFHGIGGDKYPTDSAVHQKLINYLKTNEDKYWVAPLRDVAKFIRENPK